MGEDRAAPDRSQPYMRPSGAARQAYSAVVSWAVADWPSAGGGTCFTTLATLVSVSTDAFTCLWPTHSAAATETVSPIAAASTRIVLIVCSFVLNPESRLSGECGSPKSQFRSRGRDAR